jgi:hypothetical protein
VIHRQKTVNEQPHQPAGTQAGRANGMLYGPRSPKFGADGQQP